jgi:hypothetical protein
MHLPVRLSTSLVALFALGLCTAACIRAQGGSQNASSQQNTVQNPESEQTNYGVYIPVDPLAKVRYDNRYDVSLGLAYDHMKAGPSLLQGANLGGLDAEASYWLTRHWGLQASGRGYVGTSGTAPNDKNATGGDLQGPVVKQYFFVGGLEALGPHNKHGALTAHAMFGGVYGDFQKDLLGQPPAYFDFYYNQLAPAAIVGGSIDLNRSEHWALRFNCDAVMTHYTFNEAPISSSSFAQFDVNYAMSVGLNYKFTKIKRSTRQANWVSGW